MRLSRTKSGSRDADDRARGKRLALWCRAGFEVSAGVGYAALLLVAARAKSSGSATGELLRWIGVAALVLLPLFPATIERLFSRRVAGGSRVVWLAQLVPLILLAYRDHSFLVLGSLTLLQGHLLVRSTDDRMAAWSLVLGPCLVLTGWAVSPASEWLALFPVSIIASGASLSLLRARAVETDLSERAPRILFRQRAPVRQSPPREWLRRALASLPHSLLVLALVPILYALVIATRAPFVAIWSGAPAARTAEEQRRAREREERAQSEAEAQGTSRRFPENLSYGGEVTQLAGHAVMEIRPSAKGQPTRPAPLYMRGLVLDTFAGDGVEFGAGIALTQYTPGTDAWTRLAPARPDKLELDVLLEPIFLSGNWSNVLFAPNPTTAVAALAVLYDADDRLVLGFAPQQTVRYQLETVEPRNPRRDRPRGRARHPDPRYLQLPPVSENLSMITARAREVITGAGDDAARVQRLMEHFRSDYAYSLESRQIAGLSGIVEFLRRREGHCTYFAVAAVMMLRTQKIPARIATGYLASNWSESEQLFRVSTRNGHAWIEVHFEDQGWVTYDPTPPARREAAWAAAEADPDRGIASWFAELGESAMFWAKTGGHEAYLREFMSTLIDGPRALFASARRQPGWIALIAALALFLWARRRSRDKAPRAAGEIPSGPADDELRRLLSALASRGYPRRASQTLRELALEVSRCGGEAYQPLPSLARMLQRGRYSGQPLTPVEKSELESFVDALPHDREPDSASATSALAKLSSRR